MKSAYLYLGKEYALAVRTGQKNIVELSDRIYLGSSNPKYASSYLTSWYKGEARRIIKERVFLYATRFDRKFSSVNVGSVAATTRWGSCSSQKNLNFNWKLVMAPIEVIDYVVAHELAHLSELNHSRSFWEAVRRMHPLYREYRTWLKRNGHLLSV